MPSAGRVNPIGVEALPGRSFGHLLGWRLWRLPSPGEPVSRYSGPLLMSVVIRQSPWYPGEAKVAPFPPAAGGSGANCGIYAFRTILGALSYADQALSDWVGQPLVLGEVALWGRVVEHEHGFRAQYAYPYSFRALLYTRNPQAQVVEPAAVQQVLDRYRVRGAARPERIYYLPSRGGYRRG